MYIDSYWGNFVGGTDDSLNLLSFLEDQKKTEISLEEIFQKTGLNRQNGDFHQTVDSLEFLHSDGVEMAFYFAIDLITDLAALLLECAVNGGVNLHDLEEYEMPDRTICITATPEQHQRMNQVLADFAKNPLSYDLCEMVPEKEMLEMAQDCEMLRRELYESGREGCQENH